MRSAEASAKTRQEAIRIALDKIGAEMHEVEIEILDEGSRGFLGFGARDVRVRVTAEHLPDLPRRAERPAKPEEPAEEPRRRRDEQRPPREPRPPREEGRGQQPRQEGRPPRQEQGSPRQERRDRPAQRPQQKQEHKERPERQQERGAKPGERSQKPGERPQKQERPPRPERQPKPERPREPQPPRERRPEPEPREFAPIPDERRAELAALLADMIAKMGIEATVTHKATEDGGACLSVESKDSALLIGRKGRTLEAIQYLINRMSAGSETPETVERILIDVENYLDRRRTSLEEMAVQLAQKAKESGRDVRVKPLSAPERRVIHVALQDDPDVRTFSLGSGSLRNVIISPKQAQAKREEESGAERSERSERPARSGNRRRRGRGRGGRPQGEASQDSGAQAPESGSDSAES